jgi:hypothetical protein
MPKNKNHLKNHNKFELYAELKKEITKNLEIIKIDIYKDERLFYLCDQLAYRLANLFCEKLSLEIIDINVFNEIIKLPHDLVTFITTKDYRDNLDYEYTTTFTRFK